MEHVECLGEKARNVWDAIGRAGERYVLIGGTALALRLGHRVSIDIDLATSLPCEHPRVLRRRWNDPRIGRHKWLRRTPDHYIKFFATVEAPKIDVHGRVPGGCLATPETAANGLRVASLTDILRQKLVAMCHRDESRDGEDVLALLRDGRADVEQAVAALHDDVYAMGVGEAEAYALGDRLRDLPASPWHKHVGLAALAEPLMATGLPSPARYAEHIQGPHVVPPLTPRRVTSGPPPP